MATLTIARVARATLSLAALAVVAAGFTASRVPAAHADATTGAELTMPADNWLKGLNGKHRQFFDNPAPAGGIGLVHVMNYFDTYNKAYNVKDADIDAVLTFYGATTFFALDDEAWKKYRLGEFLQVNDASGKPATANPWRTAPVILGLTLPNASIEALHKRGATLIVCNNAMEIFAALLAQQRGLDAKVVYADLKASILPQVELIPGMVIAVEQAARAGLSYHRQ